VFDDYAQSILALARPAVFERRPQFVCDLAAVGHLPNLSRTAAQKAALITIPLTGLCSVIAAQPSPDG
jgi:hypothetical protein